MLADKVKTRDVSKDKLERVYNELPVEEKDEFMSLIKDPTVSSVVIAEVVIEDRLSDFAVELGVVNLSRRINSFRRGETVFANKNNILKETK